MVIIDVKKRKPHLASNRCPVICLRHMFTALSNWRFFPASSIRVFSSRVYTRVRRGEDVVRLRLRSVSRDTLGFGCVCVHICSHHHTFVQARALALTYLQSVVAFTECPNFFIFASLSLNVVVGVRVDVFLFFVCQVSKALYFSKRTKH